MPVPPPFDDFGPLKNVGLPLRLNKYADPNNYTTHKFIRFKNVVDIVPMHFGFTLPTFEEDDSDNFLYSYSFGKAISEYKEVCGSYALSPLYNGIRCWLTEDTSHQDEITHTWTGNMIGDMINNLATKGKMFGSTFAQGAAGMAKSAGGDLSSYSPDASSFMDQALGMLSDVGDNAGVGAGGDATLATARTLFNIGVMGYHAQLPKIWKASNYSPTLTLNIKLISPYGTPEAIKKYVTDPLLYLIIISSPRTHDGITLGKIPYVYVNAYGLSNLNIGIINSVSIRRGGDNSLYNQYRQPLSIEVAMSVSPAVEGFGVVKGKNLSDIAIATDVPTNQKGYGPEKPIGPGFTTLGNIIRSFQKAPESIQYILDVKIKEEPPIFLQQVPDEQLANIKENISNRIDNTFTKIQPLNILDGIDNNIVDDLVILDLDGLADDIGNNIGNLDNFLDNFNLDDFPLNNDEGLSSLIPTNEDLKDALDKNIYNIPFDDIPEVGDIFDESPNSSQGLDDILAQSPNLPEELNDYSLKDYQSPNLDPLLDLENFENQIKENLDKVNNNQTRNKIESISDKAIDSQSLLPEDFRKDSEITLPEYLNTFKEKVDDIDSQTNSVLDNLKDQSNNKIDELINLPDSDIVNPEILEKEIDETDNTISDYLDNLKDNIENDESFLDNLVDDIKKTPNYISDLKNPVESKIQETLDSVDDKIKSDELVDAFKSNLNSNEEIKNSSSQKLNNFLNSVSSNSSSNLDIPNFQKQIEKSQSLKDILNNEMPKNSSPVSNDIKNSVDNKLDDVSNTFSNISSDSESLVNDIKPNTQIIKDSISNAKNNVASEISSVKFW